MDTTATIVVVVSFLIIAGLYLMGAHPKDTHSEIESLVDDLRQKLHEVEEISDDDLKKLEKEIRIFVNSPSKENYSFPQNYWPYYYYSYPFQSKVAWPPGLYSRLYNWQPGFTTSGWTYNVRPGLKYVRMPRARWYRNNGRYYYINNVF